MISYDPETVRPLPNHMLIELLQQLGGKNPGGNLFRPAAHSNVIGADTAWGRVLKVGPAPFDKRGEPAWPEPVIQPGELVLIPRDVPRVWGFENRRYCLAIQTEAICVFEATAEEVADGFEQVPRSTERFQ